MSARRCGRIAALLFTIAATVGAAVPAQAAPAGLGLATGSSTGLGLAPTGTPGATRTTQPLSLTATLLSAEAAGQGVDLGTYLQLRKGELDAQLGAGSLGAASSFGALNAQLGTSTFGPAFAGSGDLPSLTANLARMAGTPDANAVAGGIDLARSLGQLSSPQLAMPQLGAAATILSARPDELAFGLFANQSLAAAVKSSPNILAEVQQGQLSPASLAAFQGSLSQAATTFAGGLASALPSPCYAGMMLAVAGGATAVNDTTKLPRSCGACVTAGTYLHGRMGDLLQSGKYTPNATDGTITAHEWANMDPNSRQAILDLNPQLEQQINQVQRHNRTGSQTITSGACSAAAAGTTNFLTGNLGGVLGRLGG